MERRITAILAADVVGYSRLMGEDEVGTLERLQACRRELVDPTIEEFHGRIIKLMGDGALVEFASIVDAVQCAAVIQRRMAGRDRNLPDPQRICFRMGVNLGDIIVEGGDIYGDGVNIAARLEAQAEPGGICISGTAFDHAVHKSDVGFAALGEQRLKNIADPVRVYRVLLDPSQAGKVVLATHRASRGMAVAAIAALLIAMAAALFAWQRPHTSQRPSIAVLPFANLSGDPEQDYFADGITDNLITDLTKLSGLDVIARNSAFAYKGKSFVLAAVARDLGVRFVVEGSVQRTGDEIRINAQLINMATGDHVWANRFDRGAAEVFAVQDEMSRQIVRALGVKPTPMESERMARPPTANLEAYDNYLRAEQVVRTGFRAGLLEGLALFDKAEALDPGFAEAFAADARTTVYVWRSSYESVLQSALARKRAYEKASRALALDPDISSPYAVLAVMQTVDRRYEQAIVSAQRAVSLGPADAEAQIAVAYVQLFSGNHAEAASAADIALRLDPNLSPIDRHIVGLVFFLHGDNAKAIESFERARKDVPGNADFVIPVAAAYARAGRLDEAHAAVVEGLRLTGGADSLSFWRINLAHFRNAQDLAAIIEALRKAGLPEWPLGFTADERDRLKGKEIADLVLGRLLKGQIAPGKPALMQIGLDGKAAFRSTTQMLSEMVFVRGDSLCEQSESVFGRADCGPVYRLAKAPDDTSHVFVNSSKVFYFSPVQ